MQSTVEPLTLTLVLAVGDDTDMAERQAMAHRLHETLLAADVLSAEFASNTGTTPSGAKGVGPLDFSTILLSVAGATIPSLIVLIQHWLLRQQSQTLRVKIGEVEMEVPRNASQAEIDRIVSAVRRLPQPPKQK